MNAQEVLPILSMKNITKTFPGVKALDNVHFELNKGEVHAILGENGAGKSTLIKILGGIYQADSGSIEVDGKEVEIKSITDCKKLGISIIHQELCLSPNMTVAQNIFMGKELLKNTTKLLADKEMIKQTEEVLQKLGITNLSANDLVMDLSISKQQMVEIAKAIAFDASIIVMDEPTSSLTETEVQHLFSFIKLCQKKGISFIYISHRMKELFEISDRITVFRDGTYIDTVDTAHTTEGQLIQMMVGREIEDMYHTEELVRTDEKLLEVEKLTSQYVNDISFDLYRGEILGIFGLMGAGRTELARALFGVDEILRGSVKICGAKIPAKYNPNIAKKCGLALTPESRKEFGLVLVETVHYNILLPIMEKVYHLLKINKEFRDTTIKEFFSSLRIKASSPQVTCNTLSGGNQQKIVLAKWIATHPKVIIMDEPTRGIDVGAKSEVYSIMQDLVKQGIGIILISSELPEIINLSTRVMIMREGHVTGILERKDLTQETIMQYAVGGKTDEQ